MLPTLMASLHAWRGGSLPEGREALYADAIDLLLDSWESPKVVRDAQGNPRIEQPSLSEWLKADREKVRALLVAAGRDRRLHPAAPDLPEVSGRLPPEQWPTSPIAARRSALRSESPWVE